MCAKKNNQIDLWNSERAELQTVVQKIADQIAALSAGSEEMSRLKARKAELRIMREDLLAGQILGDKKPGGTLTLEEINAESADVHARLQEAAEQSNINRLVAEGLERRTIDANTKLEQHNRRLLGLLSEFLREKVENDMNEYDKGAELVRKHYGAVQAAGVMLAHLDGKRHPFLEMETKYLGIGGADPVLPSQNTAVVASFVDKSVRDLWAELTAMLPEDVALPTLVMH